MNHAFVDASWQEQPDGRGIGGWGLVLLTPGQLPARHQGQLDAPDNNAAELRAVLEAVRAAPAGEALTVHTDNQTVIACVARGRGPFLLSELTQEVQKEAGERGVTLRAVYAPRTRRHMLTAHDLANGARKGSALPLRAPLARSCAVSMWRRVRGAYTARRVTPRSPASFCTSWVSSESKNGPRPRATQAMTVWLSVWTVSASPAGAARTASRTARSSAALLSGASSCP